MDTKEKVFFNITGKNIDITTVINNIVAAGAYFSGSVYTDATMNNYLLFYSVNKEKIKYILSRIDTTKEVKLEICAHAKDTKNIQPEDYWPKSNF